MPGPKKRAAGRRLGGHMPAAEVARLKASVLEHLETGVSLSTAATLAGTNPRRVYQWRKEDAQFAQDVMEAYDRGTDILEDEARRRAYQGVEEPVYYQGVRVDTIRKYSDTLLIFLMKARRPTVYRDNVNITNSDNSLAGAFAATVRAANGYDVPQTTQPQISH